MNVHDICCVGHITLDKVVTPQNTVHMPGGTAFYFSHAISKLDVDYTLVTSLAQSEMQAVENLRAKGIDIRVNLSEYSIYFENIYPENRDNRTQRVLQKADPFTIDMLDATEARFYHLGVLMADDMSVDFIKALRQKGLISVDAQGYLREVRDKSVYAIDWLDKREALQYIDILKANESEMEVLTGYQDIRKGAQTLFDWGVKEVLITLGSMGSVIFDGKTYYSIPAYIPSAVVDATGCGDTYMAGYLYQRAKGVDLEEAGNFAAAMATIKIQDMGPFTGNKEDVMQVMDNNEKRMPIL